MMIDDDEHNSQYLITLEEERSQALQALHQERSTRHSLESKLASAQKEIADLTTNYNRLINPVEQIDCDITMKNEQDGMIVRMALEEKLKHIMVLSQQIQSREKEIKQKQEVIDDLKNQIVDLKELEMSYQEVGE